MKYISTFILLISFFNSPGQYIFQQRFEGNYDQFRDRFIVDTVNYSGKSWQIGKPTKNEFDSAYSYPNVIVTDTLNPYRVNDTSVFMLKLVSFKPSGGIGNWYALAGFSFVYKLDIDSGEILKVEIATDSGTHWVNLLAEDTTYDITWGVTKPDFSKSTSGWEMFHCSFTRWATSRQYPHSIARWTGIIDTTYIRFTFITDSIQTNKDGWIMDDFNINNLTESVETVINNNLISIYPNPAKDCVYIKANYSYHAKAIISIYNLTGQEVYTTKHISENGYLHFNLPDGMYLLKYSTGSELAIKQLVIHH